MNQCIFVSKVPGWTVENATIGATASSGVARIRAKIPTERRVKNGDKWEKETVWIPLVFYGKRGETFLEVVKPGSVITFTTKYRSYKYEEKYFHEFVVDNWDIISWGGDYDGEASVDVNAEEEAPF